jgi:hypothetical protein
MSEKTRLKETPSTRPELAQRWRQMYEELIIEYTKSTALQMIGDKHNVSRQTVMYHLFPTYKQKQKKRHSKQWSYQKRDPALRKKIIDYKAKYMAARYHIDDLIKKAYEKTEPQQSMTIEDLAYAVHDVSGILFKPTTLLGLSERHAAANGYPLLVELPGNEVPHYKLSEKV